MNPSRRRECFVSWLTYPWGRRLQEINCDGDSFVRPWVEMVDGFSLVSFDVPGHEDERRAERVVC